MKLSIVATLYRSAPHIGEFHARASSAARVLAGDDYEIVLVNDGSPDDSLELAVALEKTDSHLVVVDLSRNFGHHKAMMTGLAYSRGDKVFLIDSDLEEEPEWLETFSQLMVEQACDVVYGVQQRRKGAWFERWSGELYYTIFNWLSSIDHPRNTVTARLMSRRYVNALIQFREQELVISCLWVIAGFKQCPSIVVKHSGSDSTYSLPKKIAHLSNAVTSFSVAPLRFMFYSGITILFISLIFTVKLIFSRIFLSHHVDGWTSVMVSIWLLGGLVLSFLGIIGIYLSKIFSETKVRPYTIVREVYGRSGS